MTGPTSDTSSGARGESSLARLASFGLPPLIVAALALWLFQGLQATDDLRYAQLAGALLHGTPPDDSVPLHQWGRIGLYFPLAGIFGAFGVSSASLALLPFAATVATVPLVVALGRRFFGPRAGVAAGVLYALAPMTIQYATMLLPEPVATFEIALAAVLFARPAGAPRSCSRRRAVLAGLLIGLAYLTTESGALMLPVLVVYALYGRRPLSEPVALVAGFAAVLSFEMWAWWVATGNPLYRYTDLSEHYARDPMLVGDNVDLFYRAFRAYPDRLLFPSTALGVSGWMMLAGGLWGLARFRRAALFVIWAAVVFVFFNFMSASLDHYVMLPVATRLLVPGCLALVVLAGGLVVELWDRSARSRALRVVGALGIAAYAASCVLASFLDLDTRHTAVVARNAELVADRLRDERPIALISDTSSAESIRLYRGFDPRDSIFDLDAGAAWLEQQRREPAAQPRSFYLLLNGPAVHEQEITGGIYGGHLSLTPEHRAWLAKLVPPDAEPVFVCQFQRGAVFDRLFAVPALRGLFLAPGAVERRFARDPGWARASLYRLTTAPPGRGGASP